MIINYRRFECDYSMLSCKGKNKRGGKKYGNKEGTSKEGTSKGTSKSTSKEEVVSTNLIQKSQALCLAFLVSRDENFYLSNSFDFIYDGKGRFIAISSNLFSTSSTGVKRSISV